MVNNQSGMRPDKLCPVCEQPLYYTGHVDTTVQGDENRSQVRGAFVCKNPSCKNFEQRVVPRMA